MLCHFLAVAETTALCQSSSTRPLHRTLLQRLTAHRQVKESSTHIAFPRIEIRETGIEGNVLVIGRKKILRGGVRQLPGQCRLLQPRSSEPLSLTATLTKTEEESIHILVFRAHLCLSHDLSSTGESTPLVAAKSNRPTRRASPKLATMHPNRHGRTLLTSQADAP